MEAITERQSKALPAAWIDRLFERLGLAYGTDKLQALFRGQDLSAAKAYWAEELAACSVDELRAGFEAMKSAHPTWPPTLFEFRALCRPPTPTLEPELAFHEAVRGLHARREGKPGEWSHRATYWAAQDVSAFDVLSLTWPQIRSRWTRALEARAKDPNLPAIPEPPKALPAPERIRTGDDARLDGLRAMIGETARANPRAWAEQILKRHAAGERVEPIALAMARDCERIARGGRPSDGDSAAIEARRRMLAQQAAGADTFLDSPERVPEV